MPGKKPGPSVKDPKSMRKFANRRIKGQGGSDRQCSGGTRPVLGCKEGAASPARMRTGRSMTCASVPRSLAYRATPASTNPNWCPC